MTLKTLQVEYMGIHIGEGSRPKVHENVQVWGAGKIGTDHLSLSC
jgi:hypothetical protein